MWYLLRGLCASIYRPQHLTAQFIALSGFERARGRPVDSCVNGALWRGIVLLAWTLTSALLYCSMYTVSTLFFFWPDNGLMSSTTA